jgi:hypothetical protein
VEGEEGEEEAAAKAIKPFILRKKRKTKILKFLNMTQRKNRTLYSMHKLSMENPLQCQDQRVPRAGSALEKRHTQAHQQKR